MKKLISIIILFTLFSLNAFAATSSASFQVNDYDVSTQYDPVIAKMNNGDLVVVWVSDGQDGSDFGIYASIFDQSGNEVVNEFLVNEYTNGDQEYPSVTVLNDGTFVVVWARYDGAGDGVFMRRYNEDGSEYIGGEFVGGEVMTSDDVSTSAGHPTGSALNGGGFVVAYRGDDISGSQGVVAKIYDQNGNSLGNEFPVNNLHTVGLQLLNPYGEGVASLNGGGFVAVWEGWDQYSSGDKEIMARIYTDNGTPLGDEFVVNNDDDIGVQDNASIAKLENGDFVVVWRSINSNATDHSVMARRFDSTGNPTTNSFQVNVNTSLISRDGLEEWYPSVAGLSGGGYVITWGTFVQGQFMTTDDNDVYAQEYGADNSIVDSEFLVRELGTNHYAMSKVEALDNDAYFIASSRNNRVGNSEIFVDVFGVLNPPLNTVPEFSSYVYFSVLLMLGVAIRNRSLIDFELNN